MAEQRLRIAEAPKNARITVSPPIRATRTIPTTVTTRNPGGIRGLIQNYFAPVSSTQGGVRTRDIIREWVGINQPGVGTLGETFGGAAKDIARAPFRAARALDLSFGEAVGKPVSTITPTNKIDRFLLGERPVTSAQTANREKVTPFLSRYGVPTDTAKVIGTPLALIGATVDLFPGGSAGKIAKEAKTLAKLTDIAEVGTRLKKLGLADDAVTRLAPTIAKTKDASTIAKGLNAELRVAKQSVDPLLAEARKYKSAEEFVKAQTKKDYVSEVKQTTGGDIAKVGTYGEAGSAKTSARRKLANDITAKEIDIAKRDQIIFNTNKNKTVEQLQKEISDSKNFAEQNNSSYSRSIQVKEDIIKIKSQLTDIYNQAQGKATTPKLRVKAPTATTQAEALTTTKPAQELRLGKAGIPSTTEGQSVVQSPRTFTNNLLQAGEQSQPAGLLGQPDLVATTPKQYKQLFKKAAKTGQGVTFEPRGTSSAKPIVGYSSDGQPAVTVEQAKAIFKQTGKVTPNEIVNTTKGKRVIKLGGAGRSETRRSLIPPEMDLGTWKDKGAFSQARETLDRNIDTIAGSDAPKVKAFVTEPIKANETNRINFTNQQRNEIRAFVVEKNGIRANSLEDKLIQRFGEGRITEDGLKQMTPKWKQVMESADFFKAKYKEYLTKINAERVRFGYSPIPERQDYFRHYQEIGGTIDQLGLILKQEDLPTEIAGITDIFKPGKPFTTAELRRKGGKFTESAINGMDNYLDSVTKQMYHIDSVQRTRALERVVRESGQQLPNLAANLNEYGNLLAGKKAKLDRALESITGRQGLSLSNWLRSRTSANMVGGNVASALTNFIPLTQAAATTSKRELLRGLLESVATPFAKDSTSIGGEVSSYLTRRFPIKNIDATGWKLAGDKANWLFEAVDKFTAHSVVGGKYYEGINAGLSSKAAMKAADEYAAKVLADRSVGQLPNIMNTKTLGFWTQFLIEVNNVASFIAKDIPGFAGKNPAVLASMLGQFFLYSYLYNQVAEKVTGRRPTIDPIHATLTALGLSEQGKDKDITERLTLAAKDIKENLPFMSITGGRLPISAAMPDLEALKEGKIYEGLKGPAAYLALPVGGGQIKKTFEGLSAYSQGGSTTPSGSLRYPIEQTPANLGRAALFGQYSTPEAVNYFNKGQTPLGKEQSAQYFALPQGERQQFALMTRDQQRLQKIADKATSGGIDSLTPKERAAIQSSDLMDKANESIAKQNIQLGKLSATLLNDKVIYADDTKENGVSTINLSKYTPQNAPKDPLKKADWQTDKYGQARSIYKLDGLDDATKQKAFDILGLKTEDVAYDYQASVDASAKTELLSQITDHTQLLNTLLEGRKRSISNKQFATDTVINDLYNNGLVSKAEKKYLQSIYDIRDGKVKLEAGASTGGGSSKQSALQKAIKAQLKSKTPTLKLKTISAPSELTSGPKLNMVSMNTKIAAPRITTKVPQVKLQTPTTSSLKLGISAQAPRKKLRIKTTK